MVRRGLGLALTPAAPAPCVEPSPSSPSLPRFRNSIAEGVETGRRKHRACERDVQGGFAGKRGTRVCTAWLPTVVVLLVPIADKCEATMACPGTIGHAAACGSLHSASKQCPGTCAATIHTDSSAEKSCNLLAESLHNLAASRCPLQTAWEPPSPRSPPKR